MPDVCSMGFSLPEKRNRTRPRAGTACSPGARHERQRLTRRERGMVQALGAAAAFSSTRRPDRPRHQHPQEHPTLLPQSACEGGICRRRFCSSGVKARQDHCGRGGGRCRYDGLARRGVDGAGRGRRRGRRTAPAPRCRRDQRQCSIGCDGFDSVRVDRQRFGRCVPAAPAARRD